MVAHAFTSHRRGCSMFFSVAGRHCAVHGCAYIARSWRSATRGPLARAASIRVTDVAVDITAPAGSATARGASGGIAPGENDGSSSVWFSATRFSCFSRTLSNQQKTFSFFSHKVKDPVVYLIPFYFLPEIVLYGNKVTTRLLRPQVREAQVRGKHIPGKCAKRGAQRRPCI